MVDALRVLMWRQLVKRESKFLHNNFGHSARAGYGRVGFSDVLANHQLGVFFVLGNGESVNELDERHFRVIGENFSVGLNAWPLHPFVPSAYAFELYEGLEREEMEFEFLVGLAHEKVMKTGRSLFLLRPRPADFPRIDSLRAELPGLSFRFYGRVNLTHRSLEGLDSDLRSSLAFLGRGATGPEVVIDNGSSVVRMVSLALLQGFKKIVLAGVDLNSGDYFWYGSKFIRTHGDFRNAVRRNPGEGRDTLSTADRPFGAIDFICALDRVARSDYGAQIFVTSSSSALARNLETYRFQEA